MVSKSKWWDEGWDWIDGNKRRERESQERESQERESQESDRKARRIEK